MPLPGTAKATDEKFVELTRRQKKPQDICFWWSKRQTPKKMEGITYQSLESEKMLAGYPDHGVGRIQLDSRRREILSAQIKLLFGNSNIGFGVIVLAATTLALLQWRTVPQYFAVCWWLYIAQPPPSSSEWWGD